MTVTVPHRKTQLEAIGLVDRAAKELFSGAVPGPVQITDQKKEWQGPVMSFSFTGKMGFISIPLSGTVTVDDKNVIVECELPGLLKNFLGEDKVRAGIEQRVKGLLA